MSEALERVIARAQAHTAAAAPPAPSQAPVNPPAEPVAPDQGDLQGQVDDLNASVEDLAARVAELEQASIADALGDIGEFDDPGFAASAEPASV